MQFSAHAAASVTQVKLTGRLEFTDHERLSDIIALIGANDAPLFTLDLRQLEFIDSAGLGMLLILNEQAQERGVGMKILVANGGAVRQTVALARIDGVVGIEYDPS